MVVTIELRVGSGDGGPGGGTGAVKSCPKGNFHWPKFPAGLVPRWGGSARFLWVFGRVPL